MHFSTSQPSIEECEPKTLMSLFHQVEMSPFACCWGRVQGEQGWIDESARGATPGGVEQGDGQAVDAGAGGGDAPSSHIEPEEATANTAVLTSLVSLYAIQYSNYLEPLGFARIKRQHHQK